jgi:hypothetical protein
MQGLVRAGAVFLLAAAIPPLLARATDLATTLEKAVRTEPGASPPAPACRYEARNGRIFVSRIDAPTVGAAPNALDCDDFDNMNATKWIATVDNHKFLHQQIEDALHQSLDKSAAKVVQPSHYVRVAETLLKSGKILACAHIRTGTDTGRQADSALGQAKQFANAAGQARVASAAEAQRDVLRRVTSQPATQLPSDVPGECLTKGYAIPIPDETWRRMQGRSWHPSIGCPAREDLALLRVPFTDFEEKHKLGELIVARSVSADVLEVFAELYRGQFPIARMNLVDDYDGDDTRSMSANNTSAFNCRPVTGGHRLSEHAFGKAIDINPLQNPFVSPTSVRPAAAVKFQGPDRRTANQPGLIRDGDVVIQAFARIGWKWGGHWAGVKDYQHFSASGR